MADYQHIVEQFTLITGSKGAFEFRVNGDLVYSKKTIQMRHAEPGEILRLFEAIVGPDVAKYPRD